MKNSSPFKRRAPATQIKATSPGSAPINPVRIAVQLEQDKSEPFQSPPNFSYTVQELHEICNRIELNPGSMKNSSRGYISLMNLYKEMKDSNQNRLNRKQKYFGKPSLAQNHQTELVELNPDRFVSTALAKNVGLYDDQSDEAFQNAINRLLNRLTTNNIMDTFNDIKDLVKSDKHQEYLAFALVDKAMKEHIFTGLYAKFVAECDSTPIVQQNVVGKITTKFYDYCAKYSANENDSHYSQGTAKFFAALLNFRIISVKEGLDAFQELIQSLEVKNIPPHIVEMLSSFVKDCGKEFLKQIPDEIWTHFDKTQKRTDIKSRLIFILKDVDEIRQEAINGIKPARAINQQVAKKNNEHIFKVRDSYVNYQEGEEAKINLSFTDFLNAVCNLFPDQTNDSDTFCQYICDIIASKKPNARDIVTILSVCASAYKRDNIDCDSPKMWGLFDDLLYYMLLRKEISIDEMRTIMTEFPIQHCNDIVNGMKWFLLDHHDFNLPIVLDTFPSVEVRDALMMPKIVDQPFPLNFPLSRLIAIAVLRSICSKLHDNPTVQDFLKYKPYLETTIERQPKAFNEEMESLIDFYGFNFSVEDLISCINNK